MRVMLVALLLLPLSACNPSSPTTGNRWYTAQQVEMGKTVFERHCASCHGIRAQGAAGDWRVRRPDGSYPPPPLNGSAHTWHHPLPLLVEIIQQGGALYDGTMPAFGGILSEAEQYAAIAWFQSLWSDEVYRHWTETKGQKTQQGGKP